jgi:hypothetical protein
MTERGVRPAMEALATLILLYLAAGVACFAHPAHQVTSADFTWRGQWTIFRDTLPSVLTWPLVLWHMRLL